MPPQATRRADWELTLRAFADYAQRRVTPDRAAAPPAPGVAVALSDRDLDLSGAGLGLEFSLRQAFSVRVDVGMALRGLEDDEIVVVDAGDVRVHLALQTAW